MSVKIILIARPVYYPTAILLCGNLVVVWEEVSTTRQKLNLMSM